MNVFRYPKQASALVLLPDFAKGNVRRNSRQIQDPGWILGTFQKRIRSPRAHGWIFCVHQCSAWPIVPVVLFVPSWPFSGHLWLQSMEGDRIFSLSRKSPWGYFLCVVLSIGKSLMMWVLADMKAPDSDGNHQNCVTCIGKMQMFGLSSVELLAPPSSGAAHC